MSIFYTKKITPKVISQLGWSKFVPLHKTWCNSKEHFYDCKKKEKYIPTDNKRCKRGQNRKIENTSYIFVYVWIYVNVNTHIDVFKKRSKNINFNNNIKIN